VVALSYDAKGQRERIDYGNGARTVYTYDPLTYRLVRLETLRGTQPERLQDLSYTYDPVANIVEIRDGAQQTVFFAGQVVTPTTRYRYDPLYRLVSATGREHASLGPQPDHRDPELPALPHPNDAQALRAYTQTYTHDGVGNILHMAHQAGGTGWTRHYEYATDSNRLLAHSLPGDPAGVFSAGFGYDPHGNLTSMPHLASIDWDDADRMHRVDLGGGGTAYYQYDGAGQRARKVIERLGGLVEERIYLGAYEVHRRQQNGTVSFERQTVHMMDDARRIALVETTTVDGGAPADPPEVRIRYQLDNHLGSCSLELDQQAAVISYEEYHPYGTTSLWLAAPGTEVSDRRYRYTGKEKDEETGLYYHGARYYAPWLARWTAPDPIGIADGTNIYAYVHNNPVALTDPSGAQGKTIIVESEFRLFNRRTGRMQTVPGSRTKEIITVPEAETAVESDPDPTAALESDIVISLGRVRTGTTVMGDEALALELEQIREGVEHDVTSRDKTSADPANNPKSPEHVQKVMQVVNYFLQSTRKPDQTKLQNALAAANALTRLRNTEGAKGPKYSQSLVLRDAQRYFYGVLGPYIFSTSRVMRTEVDAQDPVPELEMITAGQEETVRTNKALPVSAVGGSEWYEFGQLYHYGHWSDLEQPGPAKLISPEDIEIGERRRDEHQVDRTRGLVWAVTTF
jgi:RHS repeat-associated protein